MREKSIVIFSVVILILIAAATYFNFAKNKTLRANNSQPKDIIINQTKHMNISSSTFENDASIPQKYTCDGENINPDLEISDVPSEAKSLALIVHDPDAPVAGGFTHWIVFNISPKNETIAENSVPENSIQGTVGTGKAAYTGPCPPSGTHHYHFYLYALDTMLNLDSSAKKEDVEKSMDGHILEQAELVGLYQRI